MKKTDFKQKIKKTIIVSLPIISCFSFLIKGCKKDEITSEKINIIPVVTDTVKERHFEDRLSIEATVQAKNSSLISPRISGVIQEFFVDEGDFVEEGARLFKTEDDKLIKAASIAKQNLKLAECAREEKQASHEKNRLKLNNAKREYDRAKKMMEDKAISQSTYDGISDNYESEKAGLIHSQTLVTLSEQEVERGKIALELAEKDLEDSVVYAPMLGIITKRFMETGEMASPGMAILKIEDLDSLEIRGHLPAPYYNLVSPDKTRARIKLNGSITGLWPISWKSPIIDTKYHTFEIRIDLKKNKNSENMNNDSQNSENNCNSLISGLTVQLSVLLEEKQALAVPSDALVKKADSTVIFTTEGNKAKSIKVKTGLIMDNYTEIVGSDMKIDMPIIVKGQNLVDHNGPIRIIKD